MSRTFISFMPTVCLSLMDEWWLLRMLMFHKLGPDAKNVIQIAEVEIQ